MDLTAKSSTGHQGGTGTGERRPRLDKAFSGRSSSCDEDRCLVSMGDPRIHSQDFTMGYIPVATFSRILPGRASKAKDGPLSWQQTQLRGHKT